MQFILKINMQKGALQKGRKTDLNEHTGGDGRLAGRAQARTQANREDGLGPCALLHTESFPSKKMSPIVGNATF